MNDSLLTVFGAMPWILSGAGITIGTVVVAMLLGLVFGIPMAVAQVYGRPFVRRMVGIYVWFFRGVPILVLLYLFYFGLVYQLNPLEISLFGNTWTMNFDLSPFTASCIVLGLTSSAYQSQIFRGAINSLPAGQLKAAKALGMSNTASIIWIILPQALRLSIPGWSNEYSILLKDSALVSVLGTMELMSRTKAIATSTAEYTAFYVMAAIVYFIITFIGVRGLKSAEKAIRIPGYTHL
ncbi:amino acid ABC transporter permease [Desulfovibrio sp. OttesenSCG-928-G15]|nr:amino acid ABC transporter permease [Desulfovibrio sp. OttesenSCG-928-G15]